MKTIGFVDYYISEWHADNYPVWIKEICEKTGEEFSVKYAWAEEYVSLVDGRNTDQWCEAFGVEKCDTIEELCEKSDYILVLSPSNPEKHLEYAEKVLKYKKNTYIDKTFAPDYATAKAIFEVAKKNDTKFFSSSALRYASELDELAESKNIITFGGGGNLPEYIIHQIEMVVKTINEAPKTVKVEKQGLQYICSVTFENGKNARMIYAPSLSFGVCVDTKEGTSVNKSIQSDFFKNLLADILRFYKTGEPSFDVNQTLQVIKIRDGIIKGLDNEGSIIEL